MVKRVINTTMVVAIVISLATTCYANHDQDLYQDNQENYEVKVTLTRELAKMVDIELDPSEEEELNY